MQRRKYQLNCLAILNVRKQKKWHFFACEPSYADDVLHRALCSSSCPCSYCDSCSCSGLFGPDVGRRLRMMDSGLVTVDVRGRRLCEICGGYPAIHCDLLDDVEEDSG